MQRLPPANYAEDELVAVVLPRGDAERLRAFVRDLQVASRLAIYVKCVIVFLTASLGAAVSMLWIWRLWTGRAP